MDLALVMPWATEHWWLAFWLAFWALCSAYGSFAMSYRLGRFTWRCIVVLVRGWPPAHLDADGDWKPQPEQKTEDIGVLVSQRTVADGAGYTFTERVYRKPLGVPGSAQ